MGETPPAPAAQGRVGASLPEVAAREAAGPAEGAALIWGRQSRCVEQQLFPALFFTWGDRGAGMKVHFLAWLELSLVYFLLSEFNRTEVRVRVSSGVTSISSIADSPHLFQRYLSTVVQVARVGNFQC